MEFNKKTIENDEEYLRQISKPVDLNNDDYKNIVKLLHKYCESDSEKVMAIASIQLGIPLRLIYLKKTDEKRLNENYNESKVLINPIITKKEGLVRYYENCASCLDYMGLVERPYKVEVMYFDKEGKQKKEIFTELGAVVLSHEIDHLDGILHIDKSIELYNMPFELRKEFRKTHKLEIIKKEGLYELSTTNFKNIKDIK